MLHPRRRLDRIVRGDRTGRGRLQVVVLEAQRVGWGASGRSGGQAIFGFGCDQSKIASLIGMDDSRKLFDWSLEGVRMIHERCAAPRHRLRLAPGHAHVPIKPRQVVELQALAARPGRATTATRCEWWEREQLREQLASERYLGALVRSAQRPPASPEIHAGAGARRAWPGRADLRRLRGDRAGARNASRCCGPHRRGALRFRRAGRQCLRAGHRARAGRQDHAGRHLHRRH